MLCTKCGHEIMEGVAFCSYCGEKVAQESSGSEEPVYQADVKRPLKPTGKLIVYRDRTEFVTSSVQKAIFNYTGLVSVKKGLLDNIEFITEDGHTETCPADRKCVHEALVHIEQASRVYLAQRKERLLSQGIRYSFPSSQGPLSSGVLNLSAEQAEFRAKSGKNDIVSFRDVKSVNTSTGTLNFILFGGGMKSYAVSKELRDEVLTFITDSVAPFLAQREADLLAQGIYFSSYNPGGGTLDVLADRVESKDRSGQAESVVAFSDVRTVSLYTGTLELALTDGTSRSFPVEEDISREILDFVKKAIEPYVAARTVGFDMTFGIDEQIEFNEERSVFHIIRQNGREITAEWPMDALTLCEWTENDELSTLGNMVSGGIALFKSAAKAAGSQSTTETEEKISRVDVILTLRMEQNEQSQGICFGKSSVGMSRTDKKYVQCLEAWDNLSVYLKAHCPSCELIDPVIPEPENELPELSALPDVEEAGTLKDTEAVEQKAVDEAPDTVVQRDDLGIAKYIEGVARFIGNCATPMTIAFQGNRGNGKNNILRRLFNHMKDNSGGSLVWISAREFPRDESGEALSLLVGRKLIEHLNGESGPVKQPGTLLTGLAGLATGIIAGDTSIGKEIAGGVLNKNSADSQDDPALFFSKQINAETQGGSGKVIFFIDGLSQLDSTRAVALLDAMQDFFDCKGCVFVVAADYADILRGAKELYDENRAKSFFDGIFKAAFQVPESSYNVQSYAESKLKDMGVHTESEGELTLYAALIQNSAGRDTEAIDRLFVSFQLLKDMTGGEVYESRYKRLALFALLCMQTRFRDVYDYAVRHKDNVTPEFLTELCGESVRFQGTDHVEDAEKAAYRKFGSVLSQVVNLDDESAISTAECSAFAEVLELSGVTSR